MMNQSHVTKRVARLDMTLTSPTMHSKSCTAVSVQQWRLINEITDSIHPSHVHNAKGTEYTLLHTAKLESDQTEMAVYIDEHHQVWVRPMSEFQEKFTEKTMQVVPYFEPIDDEDWD